MGKYSIPLAAKKGFDIIAELDASKLELLAKILSNATIGNGPKVIVEGNKGVLGISDEDFLNAVRSIFSIINIYVQSGNLPEKFAADFGESFFEQYPDSTNSEDLKNALIILIPSFTSIKLSVKARDIITLNQNNYSDSRILTDIRIVFNDDEKDNPAQCAVIIHHLSVKYFSGKTDNNISLSLDSADLKSLKYQVDRAIEKEKTIRENHKFNFIEIS